MQPAHFTTHLIEGDFINVGFPGARSFTGSRLSQRFRTFCFTGLIFLRRLPIHPSSFVLWPIFAPALVSKRTGGERRAAPGQEQRKRKAGRVRKTVRELREFQQIYGNDLATCTCTNHRKLSFLSRLSGIEGVLRPCAACTLQRLWQAAHTFCRSNPSRSG